MPMTDAERQNVLTEIERGHHDLVSVLDSLTDEEMLRPNTVGHWSGKDVLAHLAGWLAEGSRHIAAREAGQTDSIPAESEFDAFNEEQVAKTRDWTLDQVRAYFESVHLDFVRLVESSPVMTPGFATGLSSHHYHEHLDQFRSMKTSA